MTVWRSQAIAAGEIGTGRILLICIFVQGFEYRWYGKLTFVMLSLTEGMVVCTEVGGKIFRVKLFQIAVRHLQG
jgi:hypothetical protein